jgi:hypothetical protein
LQPTNQARWRSRCQQLVTNAAPIPQSAFSMGARERNKSALGNPRGVYDETAA